MPELTAIIFLSDFFLAFGFNGLWRFAGPFSKVGMMMKCETDFRKFIVTVMVTERLLSIWKQ